MTAKLLLGCPGEGWTDLMNCLSSGQTMRPSSEHSGLLNAQWPPLCDRTHPVGDSQAQPLHHALPRLRGSGAGVRGGFDLTGEGIAEKDREGLRSTSKHRTESQTHVIHWNTGFRGRFCTAKLKPWTVVSRHEHQRGLLMATCAVITLHCTPLLLPYPFHRQVDRARPGLQASTQGGVTLARAEADSSLPLDHPHLTPKAGGRGA